MSLPAILLIGRIGQVGWELRRTLASLGPMVCIDYPEVDLTEGASIGKWVRDVMPDIIVNAAAYTAVDRAESEPELAMKINGVAPGIMAEEAKKIGALLVHYSTDYIFDGSKRTPYTEEDVPHPTNAYGRSKLAGDRAIQAVNSRHLIFRLCWVYGARGNNFMLTMMRLAREREKLRVVCDQIGSPTWSRLIAEATALAVKSVGTAAAADQYQGVYHLSAAGSTSWHDFAAKIVDLMPSGQKKCHEIEAISTSEYPTPAQRPAYSVLSGEKLKRTFGLCLPPWEETLKWVAEEI